MRPDLFPLARRLPAGLLLALVAPLAAANSGDGVATPNAERRAEILNLVRQDCGSCHGMTMKGGLGPALTPEALQARPADALAATILHGRPGTAMPPWQSFLSVDEADWIVDQLRRGLHDAR
jgi:cytochrome c55X